jgi:site-specific DNA recombinase
MDIAILARVSSQRQEKEETIETQLQYGRNWAQLNRHRVPDGCVYADEGVSGLTPLEEREEGRRLLDDAKAKRFEAVAFYRLDRLGRNILVVHTAIDALEKLGIGVLSMTENFNSDDQFGKLMIGFLALLAQWERESLLMRTAHGKERVAKEGKWTGGRARFGYQLEAGRPTIRPDVAPVVMEIFNDFVLEGLALQKLADCFNGRGVPNPAHTRGEVVRKGKPVSSLWYPGTLRGILTDPIYMGQTKWNGIPQSVDPIVPADIWAQAQVKLKSNKQWKSEQWDERHDYLLRGLVYCSCGRTAQGTTWTNGRRLSGGRHCYKCRNSLVTAKRRGGTERCTMPSLLCGAEQQILAECRRFLETPGLLLRLLSEQQGGAREQQERLRQDLYTLQHTRAGLHEERERLRKAFRKGSITDEEWEQDSQEIERERLDLTERIDLLAGRIGNLDREQDQLEDAENLLEQMRRGNLSSREIILGLVRKVTIVQGQDGKGYAAVDYWPKASVTESVVYSSSTERIHDTFVLRRAYAT